MSMTLSISHSVLFNVALMFCTVPFRFLLNVFLMFFLNVSPGRAESGRDALVGLGSGRAGTAGRVGPSRPGREGPGRDGLGNGKLGRA